MKRFTLHEENSEKLKVVLDTNVIVSAAFHHNRIPASILRLVIKRKIINYVTVSMIKELLQVFKRPAILQRITEKDLDYVKNAILAISVGITPLEYFHIINEDPDDNKFIDCAIASGAKYIISGDRQLLNIKQFRDIRICSPTEFVSEHLLHSIRSPPYRSPKFSQS
ncbi:MAG: putative toxin-antitoxin system toxin component, PIN family [Nanoarchaeota archaeon]